MIVAVAFEMDRMAHRRHAISGAERTLKMWETAGDALDRITMNYDKG